MDGIKDVLEEDAKGVEKVPERRSVGSTDGNDGERGDIRRFRGRGATGVKRNPSPHGPCTPSAQSKGDRVVGLKETRCRGYPWTCEFFCRTSLGCVENCRLPRKLFKRLHRSRILTPTKS